MNDPIDDLVQRWKKDPSPATTVALCDALSDSPRAPLVAQVGRAATQKHAGDVTVLVSVARMYVEADHLAEAQTVLVAAGKQDPKDGRVYRWLGEVLLRRGDAERAQKVLERALQLGHRETSAQLWLERARGFRALQASEGERAVAAEVAQTTAVVPRSNSDSFSDLDTRPHAFDVPSPASFRPPSVSSPKSAGALRPPPSRPPPPSSTLAPPRNGLTPHPPGPYGAPPPFAPPPPFAAPPPPPPFGAHAPLPSFGAPPPPPPAPAPPPPRGPWPAAAAPSRSFAPPAPSPGEAPGAAGWVPHPRDVIDALALAGIFEHQAGVAVTWDRAQPGPKRKGAATIITGMVLFLGASVGTYLLYQHKRAEGHMMAETILAHVDDELHEGKPDTLSDMEKELGRALQLESRSPRAALDWTRERAMVGLLKSGADVAFEDAMARAKEVGVPEEKVAFAQVASFLLQGDTAGAASVLPRWDGPAANDPWYQLVTAAALERAGDERAKERYASAVQMDPALFTASVGLARATAFEGDPDAAMKLARALRAKAPDRAEPVALVALAWGRDPMREAAAAPPEVDAVQARTNELPATLRFVPPAVAALRALDRHAPDEARADVSKGLAVAESPGPAVWLGSMALPLGDEALARKAAVLALQFSAVYAPARALAARVALIGGRLDEALKATEELDATSIDVAVVHAAAAYERVDPDGLARAFDALPAEARKFPLLSALGMGAGVLAGKWSADAAALVALANDDPPWGDLIAMDAALDGGDMATADRIATTWGKDAEVNPLLAIRLARLARYEGRLDAADALSLTALDHGTVTPRVLWERAFELVARGHGGEVATLLGRYPLALGPVSTWLSAYASASSGAIDAAKGKLASLDPPPDTAPLEIRVVTAAAYGAMKDKRHGIEYVKSVLAAGKLHPDLVAAALSLGMHRVERGRHRVTYE